MNNKFKLVANYRPAGDQGKAISQLIDAYEHNLDRLCLLGVTGSGKTYTMASFIAGINRPALILTHNKTLAAQLYRELRGFFPSNAVEYFVSYYNYYQPEAYVPTSDTYIEKDSSVNEEIDKLRLRATSSLLERSDVVVVASVSCIYGLGSPEDYRESLIILEPGMLQGRSDIMRRLLYMQYDRNDMNFARGKFRVRGDTIEVLPAYREEGIRIEWFGDEVERISLIDPLTGSVLIDLNRAVIYPAKHFITPPARLRQAVGQIEAELDQQVRFFQENNKPLEAERIISRTRYDIEMLQEMGYCNGIENYSRHLSGRNAGEPPACLLNYFPKDSLMIVDESHVTMPQIRGMYEGDQSRKRTLVDFGFRLPSALDNRPLNLREFEKIARKILYVSATPGDYERERAQVTAEQIIRPTGLMDPRVEVRPKKDQIEDLLLELRLRIKNDERILITTLTKRMAEDLADYIAEMEISVAYLHSEIQTIERVEIIRDLRKGIYDVLVGVNLLREGLDIPEVSLVVIFDADQEGFLRNARSLIQTIGRAARNSNGSVIMYADQTTNSMRVAIDETNRRRQIQADYNQKHNINPRTIQKEIQDIIERDYAVDKEEQLLEELESQLKLPANASKAEKIRHLRRAMLDAAHDLQFEKAAFLRDKLKLLEEGKERNKKGGIGRSKKGRDRAVSSDRVIKSRGPFRPQSGTGARGSRRSRQQTRI